MAVIPAISAQLDKATRRALLSKPLFGTVRHSIRIVLLLVTASLLYFYFKILYLAVSDTPFSSFLGEATPIPNTEYYFRHVYGSMWFIWLIATLVLSVLSRKLPNHLVLFQKILATFVIGFFVPHFFALEFLGLILSPFMTVWLFGFVLIFTSVFIVSILTAHYAAEAYGATSNISQENLRVITAINKLSKNFSPVLALFLVLANVSIDHAVTAKWLCN